MTILVADVPAGIASLRKIMGEMAALKSACKIADALGLLSPDFDLVVCGVHFDESRMFDFLMAAKSDPGTRHVPFICFRDLDSALHPTMLRSLEISCRALGAEFVDLFELKRKYGVDEADERFRELILSREPK